MTATEEQNLRAFQQEIAEAEQSPWQPACIAAAFARTNGLRFTMQGWIDLELARSPLLEGRLPETVGDFNAALRAFDLGEQELTLEETTEVGLAALDAIADGFAMRLGMECPGPRESTRPPGWFGSWLPLLACLVGQIGMSREEALACPVGQAFALLAAHRYNHGWDVAGEPYGLRGIEKGGVE